MRRLLILLAACSAPPAASPATPRGEAPRPIAPASTAPILRATSGDLDGRPGDERVELRTDGTLAIGTARTQIALDHSDEVFDKQIQLRVVELGGGRRGVLFAAPTEEPEDPPDRFRVFVLHGDSIVTVFDQTLGTYGLTPLVFTPDGTGHYVEDGWSACKRAHHPTQVPRDEVLLQLDRAGTKLVEVARKPSGQVQICDELAACPFVDVVDRDGAHRMGEILRDVRGASAATLQSLAVTAGGATTAIRISEEKPEVTYLDEVYLEVDGVRTAPTSCGTAAPPAYCVADGRPYVLRQGDVLELEFTGQGSSASLFARGYYVPTPTAVTR